MGLALTIARRSLLQRPGRTLFSVVGIALGIATVVGVVVLDFNTVLGLSAPFEREGAPDIELSSDGPEGAIELSDIEGVSLASRTFRNDAVARLAPQNELGRDREKQQRVSLVALEAKIAPRLSVYSLEQGRDLDPAATRREVLIGAQLASDLGLAVGDTVWLSRPKRPGRKRCEDGVLVALEGPVDQPVEFDFEVVGLLTRERLGRRSSGMVVIVDFAPGEEIYRGAHLSRRWWGVRDPTVDVERLKSTLARTYSYELNQAAILGQAADERAFRSGVRMAGLLALLLGLYVIFHTLSMSLTERIGEVGTLHALGTRRRQIARIFLLEATLLAGGGAALGLAAGIGLARVLIAFGITTLGTGKHIGLFVVPWSTALALAGIGFLIALVGSVYPLITLGGTSSVRVLRGEGGRSSSRASTGFRMLYALLLAIVLPSLYFVVVPVVGEVTSKLVTILLGAVGFLAVVIVLSLAMPSLLAGVCSAVTRPFSRLWPLAGRLAARAIRDAPARIGVSTSALALVCAGLVGLKSMTRSLQGEVEVWAEEAVLDKVWVRNMPGTEFDALKTHLHEYPGVLGVEKGNARIHAPFLILGVDVDELAAYGPCAEDPALLDALAEQRGIVLSRRLAEDLAYRVGDPLKVSRANGEVEELIVVAISDAYGHYPFPDERMYGVIADDLMEAFYCIDVGTVTEVAVRLAPQTDPGIVEAAVFDFHHGPHEIHFRTGAEVRDHHVADIQRDFILFDVLIVLTAALAGLGVLNGQLLAALERSKEIGVLKALGASRRQLAGMLLLESGVVGLVGGVLGVALGAALTPLVITALERLAGLGLPQVGAGAWYGIALIGAIVVALLSSLYPVWRVHHVDAVRAVRTG